MKKIILLLFFVTFAVITNAQTIFHPVPSDIFKTHSGTFQTVQNPSAWLWRMSAIVTATELTYEKATKQFISAPLSSVGPAIGYKHFYALPDGTPATDWGVSGALLLGMDINHIDPASMKAAILLNAFQFINVGGVYTFNNANHFGILIGASINF
jgi:hypothetical protein